MMGIMRKPRGYVTYYLHYTTTNVFPSYTQKKNPFPHKPYCTYLLYN